jgi:peptidoglycan LD-endopeptidase LytH
VCVALGACRPEQPGTSDSGSVSSAPLSDPVITDTTTRRVTDSAAGAVAGAVPVAIDRSDTSALSATLTELAELRASLRIPVQGVAASSLRDTYEEARGSRVHQALDILAPRGTPVLSATSGRVLKLHQSGAGGLMVYAADSTSRFILMYGHLDRYAAGLTEGMAVRQGQTIGYVGTTGNAPPGTPHLHFAIARGRPSVAWWRGTAINPFPLLAGVGEPAS